MLDLFSGNFVFKKLVEIVHFCTFSGFYLKFMSLSLTEKIYIYISHQKYCQPRI